MVAERDPRHSDRAEFDIADVTPLDGVELLHRLLLGVAPLLVLRDCYELLRALIRNGYRRSPALHDFPDRRFDVVGSAVAPIHGQPIFDPADNEQLVIKEARVSRSQLKAFGVPTCGATDLVSNANLARFSKKRQDSRSRVLRRPCARLRRQMSFGDSKLTAIQTSSMVGEVTSWGSPLRSSAPNR